MKTKKFSKRMTLNKTTVSNLENRTMNNVKGGAPSLGDWCDTWVEGSCPTECYSVNPPAFCQDLSFCTCVYC